MMSESYLKIDIFNRTKALFKFKLSKNKLKCDLQNVFNYQLNKKIIQICRFYKA